MLVQLLDPEIPAIAGSELNEDPFSPITKYGRRILAEKGDATPIAWIPREERYREKLATPDVTIADLIGDIDPIKAATERRSYSDEEVIHFGIVPRTNRGIFAINELPDLQPRIQVGLLNILEERDLQIRGFPVRIPLDILLVFSANPEDYTNRGNIITPLKDRISSQIFTHYPDDVKTAAKITAQEAWLEREGRPRPSTCPNVFRELVEEIAFAARAARVRGPVLRRLGAHADLRHRDPRLQPRAARARQRREARLAAALRPARDASGDHRQGRDGLRGRAAGRRGRREEADRHGASRSSSTRSSRRRTPDARASAGARSSTRTTRRGAAAPFRAPAPAPEKIHALYEPIVAWFAAGNRVTLSDDTAVRRAPRLARSRSPASRRRSRSTSPRRRTRSSRSAWSSSSRA